MVRQRSGGQSAGQRLITGLHTIHITNAETDTGLVQLELAGGLLEDYREFQGKSMIAYTSPGQRPDLFDDCVSAERGLINADNPAGVTDI